MADNRAKKLYDTILKELGVDLNRYKEHELLENLPANVRIPIKISQAIIFSLVSVVIVTGLAILLMYFGTYLQRMSFAGGFVVLIPQLLASVLVAIFGSLLFVVIVVSQDFRRMQQYAFELMVAILRDVYGIKDTLKDKQKLQLKLVVLIQGVMLVLILPRVKKLLLKIPLLGWLAYFVFSTSIQLFGKRVSRISKSEDYTVAQITANSELSGAEEEKELEQYSKMLLTFSKRIFYFTRKALILIRVPFILLFALASIIWILIYFFTFLALLVPEVVG